MSVSRKDRESCIETYEYGHGVAQNRLLWCPLCGYEFEKHEHRWKHFHEEHGPEDIQSGD